MGKQDERELEREENNRQMRVGRKREEEKDCCEMKEDWQERLCLIFIFICGELCE